MLTGDLDLEREDELELKLSTEELLDELTGLGRVSCLPAGCRPVV